MIIPLSKVTDEVSVTALSCVPVAAPKRKPRTTAGAAAGNGASDQSDKRLHGRETTRLEAAAEGSETTM